MSWAACFTLVYAFRLLLGVWAIPIAFAVALTIGVASGRVRRSE